MRSQTIGIGVQSGGRKADAAIALLHRAFNRALRESCRGDYCESIDTYGIVLRVSGDLDDFGFEGVDALRRNKARRLITADIGIPEVRWSRLREPELKRYLAASVEDALKAFIDRLKKDGEQVEEEALLGDYRRAVDAFLGEE